jgi:uncharacterized membrane protein
MGTVAALVVAATVVVTGAPAHAFSLTTDYPAVRVGPGQKTELSLKVTSDRVERVNLAIVQAPAGWRARLTGGGFEIGAVFTNPQSPPTVNLEVSVPADAPKGRQQVVVRGDSGRQVVDLPVDFDVAEDVAGAFSLTTDFTRLRGSATDTFTFNLTLESNSPRQATFNLEAAGPRGWDVSARPTTQQQAATVTVQPGSNASIEVRADPPDDAKAGTYPVRVRATGPGTTLEADLAVEIVGTYNLEFSTTNERLNARGSAGRTSSVSLVVRNSGSAPLQGVTFSASPPSGWDVEFRPARLDLLPAGESRTVVARIRPSGDAVAGDYAVTLTASGGGKTSTVDLRFAVKTSGWWGFVGLLVIAAAVAALLYVFRRFGHR